MNHYRLELAPPTTRELAISAAVVPDPHGGDGDHSMQVGVASPALTEAERDPMS